MTEVVDADDAYILLDKIGRLHIRCGEDRQCSYKDCIYYTKTERKGYSCIFATLSEMLWEIERRKRDELLK
jgi:hypothetical protein